MWKVNSETRNSGGKPHWVSRRNTEATAQAVAGSKVKQPRRRVSARLAERKWIRPRNQARNKRPSPTVASGQRWYSYPRRTSKEEFPAKATARPTCALAPQRFSSMEKNRRV